MEIVVLENELKVLDSLKRLGSEETLDRLSALTGLTKDQIASLAPSMRDKGLVELKEARSLRAFLTAEGERHGSLGLPERRALNWLLVHGRASLDGLGRAGLEAWEIPIAIAWLRKKGWAEVSIIDGKKFLIPTELGKKHEKEPGLDEEALSLIHSEGPRGLDLKGLSEGIVEAFKGLKARGLVKLEELSEERLRLTDLGSRALKGEVKLIVEVSRLTRELILSGNWRNVRLKRYDVTLPSYQIFGGRKHFARQILEHIRRIWVEMGFREMKGPLVETCFWNFDALFVPQDHPARDLQDTFHVKNPIPGDLPGDELVQRVQRTHEDGWTTGSKGWRYKWDREAARELILRTHTTSLSARALTALKDSEIPAKFFSVGKVFRNEKLDWSHLCEFYQTDGIVVDENANLSHLIGYLRRYLLRLGFREEQLRFRPAYFPYTEPSLEVEFYHPFYGRWVELIGAGVFRPEVVKPLLGRDIPVLAWGPAFERIVMINYGIKDIREVYSNDLEQLRRAKAWIGW
jgi:phenylalanyl-tRNA synthetase alpha chain